MITINLNATERIKFSEFFSINKISGTTQQIVEMRDLLDKLAFTEDEVQALGYKVSAQKDEDGNIIGYGWEMDRIKMQENDKPTPIPMSDSIKAVFIDYMEQREKDKSLTIDDYLIITVLAKVKKASDEVLQQSVDKVLKEKLD